MMEGRRLIRLLPLRLRSVLENKGFKEGIANDGIPVTMTASGADGHGRGTAGHETAGCGNQRGAVSCESVKCGSW